MVQRSLTFLAVTSILGCTGDPTGDLQNGPDHLVATPSAVYVGNGTIQSVLVSSVDAQGNQVEDKFTLNPADIGPNITVVRDSSFDLVHNDKGELVLNPHPTRVRYNVTTTDFVASEFTVRAGSRSITIPVRTEPVALTGAISDLTPNLGDTVTITAPAGLSFNPASSVVTYGTTATFLVSRSATEIRFVPPPAVGGAATVSNVTANYVTESPVFTVPTSEAFAVPGVPALTASATGLVGIGDSITLTLPAPFKWGRGTGATASTVTSTGASLSAPSVSADSSVIKFQIGPNATDTLRVNNLRIAGTTLTGYIMKAQAATSTPAVTNFAGTFSSATPALNDVVVLTAPANFRFLPTATVSLAGGFLIRIGVSADSTQLRFVPGPGTAASAATVTGVVFSNLRSVSLTLPTAATLTPPATPAGLAGTNAVATAPDLPIPAATGTLAFFDGGPFLGPPGAGAIGSRLYKVTVATAGTFAVTFDWQGSAATDMDIFFRNATNTASVGAACPNAATGAKPETTATCTLAAGTYIVRVDYYAGTAPTWIGFRWVRQ